MLGATLNVRKVLHVGDFAFHSHLEINPFNGFRYVEKVLKVLKV